MQETANHFSFAGKKELVTSLLDVTGLGIVILGPDAELQFANRTAIDILGFDDNDWNRKFSFADYYKVLHEDGSVFPPEAHPDTAAVRTGHLIDNITLGIEKTPNAEKIWLLVNAQPVYDNKGKLSELVCSFNNITGHKAAEEKLTTLYQDLEQKALELAASNADLERFVYAATHDLQEPLRIISSFLQLLQHKYEPQLDDMAKEYIQFAVNGARRMKSLILDLLEYSGISTNKEAFRPVNLERVLRKLCASFEPDLSKATGKISVGAMPTITADATLISLLFENLIDNAIKYSGDRPPDIHISCKEEGSHYVFSIADKGIGIEPGYTQKIFNLFQRLHHDKDGRSTGAGLAICKKITRLHNGNIWVTATPGRGSTFSFNIPVKNEPQHEEI